MRNKVLRWCAFGLCLVLSAGLFVGFILVSGVLERGRTWALSAEIREGSTIYQPVNETGYRYGPTMMYNEQGVLEAWFSSLPEGSEYAHCWDVLTYRSTGDYGETWSEEYVSLAPLAGTEEAFSVCDPAVIHMDGYYYMFYTSTIESQGRYNNVYCARASSPDGQWDRWNGQGWGGNVVKPVIVYGSNAEHYGIGEPSVVIYGEKLYIYYTYKGMLGNGQVVNQTRLTVGDANENFPLTLCEYGVVVGGKDADEDSLDVKYAEDYDLWIGVTTADRMSYRSRVKIYYSYDGKNFKEAEVNDAAAKKYLHNIGITGDGQGHIDLSSPQFVCYAYSEGGFSWGKWNTEFQQIVFSLQEVFDEEKGLRERLVTDPGFEGGEAPAAWALSTASEYRSALEAVDGDGATFYSSVGHSVTGLNEWHSGKWFCEAIALPSKGSAKGMTVTPRPENGGVVYGFPRAFKLQYSDDGVIWQTIAEYTDFVPDGAEAIAFPFGRRIRAKYFRMLATELGEDEFGTYIFQIAEIALQ